MSVPPSGDYSPAHVPTVFVEMPPPPPPAAAKAEDKGGGIFISRGFLGILVVLLLGALAAVAWMLNDQVSKVTVERNAARDQVTALNKGKEGMTTQITALTTERDTLKKALEPYATIDAAYKQVKDKNADIQRILLLPDRKAFGDETQVGADGRPLDANWRKNKLLRDRLNSVAWTQTTVTLLQEQLAKLDELNTAVANFNPRGGASGAVVAPPVLPR